MGGGAWPFLFGEVIRLVDHFNDRDFSLLNSVQHDSYLTTSYKDFVCMTQGSLRQKRVCDAFLCSMFCHGGFFSTDSVWAHFRRLFIQLRFRQKNVLIFRPNVLIFFVLRDPGTTQNPCLDAFLPNSDSYQ